jgi:branched-chain amino acid transport system substrate-binding protein
MAYSSANRHSRHHSAYRFMPRTTALVAALVATVGLTSCAGAPEGGGEAPGGAKTIQLGAILPLTGANAQNGNNSLQGLELAIEEINEQGGIKSMGGAKLELNSVDSTSDPARAANAATQFLGGGEEPLAMFGAFASGLTETVARVTERSKIPLLSTSFSSELTEQGYEYFFQVAPSTLKMGNAQLDYALEIAKAKGEEINKVAIVFANNAFGVAQAESLREQATASGKEVVLFEGYSPTITDAGPIASKVMSANADAIFSIAYVTDGVLLTRSLNSLGNTAPFFGGSGGYTTPDFSKAIGAEANGVFSVNISNPDEYGDFGEKYNKMYDVPFASPEAHMSAASVYIVAQALEDNPTTDPAVLAKALHSGTTFNMGVAAQLPGGGAKFNEKGVNLLSAPLMVQYLEGDLVGVWPEDLVDGTPNWPTNN